MFKKLFYIILLIISLNSISGEYPWSDYPYYLEPMIYPTDYAVNNSYWIDDLRNGNYKVWVKVSIPAHKNISFTIERGGTNTPDGNAVFDFFDDFETWDGWSQYGNGKITQTADYRRNGYYALEKTTDNDPNGGYKNIGKTLGRDIILECWNYRPNNTGGSYDRVGVIDNNGNGYGIMHSCHDNNIGVDRRTNYNAKNWKTKLNHNIQTWYFMQYIIKDDGTLNSNLYDENLNLLGSYSHTDSKYYKFTRVYVFGGHDYAIDDLRIRKYANESNIHIKIVKIDSKKWNITIINNNNYNLIDYQVGLDGTNDNSATNKLYITSADDSLKISSYKISYRYKTWTKVNIPPNQSVKLLVNNNHTYNPNPDNVFEFFDDFSIFDANKWDDSNAGSYSVNNGHIKMWNNWGKPWSLASSFSKWIQTKTTFNIPFTVEYRGKTEHSTSGYGDNLAVLYNSGDTYVLVSQYSKTTVHPPITPPRISIKGAPSNFNGKIPDSNWHKYDFTIKSDAIILHQDFYEGRYYKTGVLSPSGWIGIAGDTDSSSKYDYIDYLFIRKYADPEPTVTVNQINSNEWVVDVKNSGNKTLTNFQIPFESPTNEYLNISLLLPDLTINKVDVKPSGVNTTFTVYYKNIGESSTINNFTISIYGDGALLGYETVNPLDGGDTSTITFTYPTLSIFKKNITIVVDSGNSVRELDESNNNWTGMVSELPDLKITNVSTEMAGKFVKFIVNYENQGDAAAGDTFTISLDTNGYTTSRETGNIGAKCDGVLILSAPIDNVFNKLITVEVDSKDDIHESDEENNNYTLSEIPLSDLIITDVSIDQSSVNTAKFKVYYKNVGNASTGTGFYIGLFANGILIDEKQVDELDKNSSGSITLEGKNYFGQIGYYTIYIDNRNDIYESEESNNIKNINTQLPDLTIKSAKKVNNGKQIEIDYANLGDTTISNFSIALYVDDIKRYYTVIKEPIKPNQLIKKTLNWDISNVSGDSEIYIMIDSENKYLELNEWNNIYYLQGNYKPYAYFTFEINGTTVKFNASQSKDIDGDIIKHIWDFGDNNTGNGISPSHSYGEKGMYKVVLTVKDNGGKTDTTYRYVYIKEPDNRGGNSIPVPIYVQLLIILSMTYFISSIMRGLK